MDDYVIKICVGPGKLPNELKCIHGNYKNDPKKVTDFHKVCNSVDILPYNGIRNWRCEKCFAEHRKLINQK